MFATLDLNSVFNPPAGSPETSTVSFLGGTTACSCGLGPDETVAANWGDDPGRGSASFDATVGGVTAGLARAAWILFSSRATRSITPGPLTTLVSFTNPVPGTNQRSSLIDMSDESSHRR